jgi:hypothetical protein
VQTALELPSSVRSSRLTPAELSRLGHPTPYLLMDLDAVDRAYLAVTGALPDVAIRYAVKLQPRCAHSPSAPHRRQCLRDCVLS